MSVMNVDMVYLERALERRGIIKIRPPILRVAEGNHFLHGYEIKDGERSEISGILSEEEFDRLLLISRNYNNTHKTKREDK